jgi:hypothetical protein
VIGIPWVILCVFRLAFFVLENVIDDGWKSFDFTLSGPFLATGSFVFDDTACGLSVLEGGCFFEGGGDVGGVGNSYHIRIGVGIGVGLIGADHFPDKWAFVKFAGYFLRSLHSFLETRERAERNHVSG